MNVGTKVPQVQLISHIVSDEQTELQKSNAGMNISESDLINLTLELEAQLSEVKSQNEELMQALENREAANKKYTSLFEKNPCGLFILSENGVIVELNAAGAAIFNKKKSMLINRNFISFISDASKAEFNNCFKTLFETHCSSKLNVKLRKLDGSTVFVHIDAEINEVKLTCFLSISIIAEQKLADGSFQIAENKYRRLHESLMDGFAHVNMSGKIIECNEIFCTWLGYTVEEIKNLGYTDITPEYWHKQEEKILVEQVMKCGFSEVYEKEYRRKDGTVFPIELRTILMSDDDGEKIGMWAIVRDISQRKQVENKLRLNEEKYRTLIEFAPDAFFQGDAVGNLIVVNNKAIELTGFSKAELLSMNLSELIPESIIKNNPLRYDLLKHGSVIKTERAILRKSGELVNIEMNSKGMPDGTYQCFARDITGRKRAEEVLRESEERYRELADSITDDFFSLDKDLKFTYCNKSFEKNSGFKITDIIGKFIGDVYPDIKDSVRKKLYLDVLKTQQPGSCVDEFHVKGEKKYFEIKAYPSEKGLVIFIYDIHNRIQTEKELTLFKSIIEASDAAVAVTDPDGKLIYVNPAHEKLFGQSFEEAMLINFRCYHTEESLKILDDEMMPALQQGKSWEGELFACNKDGLLIPLWVHAGSIQDADGQNVVLFTILDDISGQKKAETDKLHLELIKGEDAERLRIAHDLHNHIGHIIVAIKIHIERAIASSADEKHIAQLENILDKVIFAIKEVRLVSSKLAERFSAPWRLRQQISTFLTDLEITSGIQIVQKIDPLPDEISDLLMRNVVGILEEALSNVMKHSDAKSVYIHIFIKKNRFFLNIRDNGKGMDNSQPHEGSGLDFLKQEAEQIDGEISIKSVPGKFCMLKFNAPVYTAV